MLTTKQELILLFISGEPGMKHIRKLITFFDRHDFPSDMGFNLQPLLDNKLIYVSHNFENGTPARYEITGNGKSYLETFNDEEVLNYVRRLEQPNLITAITEVHIERKNNNLNS